MNISVQALQAMKLSLNQMTGFGFQEQALAAGLVGHKKTVKESNNHDN